jgi:hypothetical protein
MKLQLFIVVSFISFFCVRCSDTSKEATHVVDLEEFLPKPKKEYNYEEDTISQVETVKPDSIELLIQTNISNVQFVREEKLRNKKHFPDRLDYTQRFCHELTIDSLLYELVIWEFEDSIYTINAFYNWMDCFGTKCRSIRIGEDKWINEGAFQLFVDDTKLIYVTTEEKMNQKLWDNLFQPVVKNNWNYHLYQPLNRKVKWLEEKI